MARYCEALCGINGGAVPLNHMHWLYQHLCDCLNLTATESIVGHTPWEILDGEDTPDISVLEAAYVAPHESEDHLDTVPAPQERERERESECQAV